MPRCSHYSQRGFFSCFCFDFVAPYDRGSVVTLVSPFMSSFRVSVRLVNSLGSPCFRSYFFAPRSPLLFIQFGGPENVPALSVCGIFVDYVFICFLFQAREGNLNPFLTYVLKNVTWLEFQVVCPCNLHCEFEYINSSAQESCK